MLKGTGRVGTSCLYTPQTGVFMARGSVFSVTGALRALVETPAQGCSIERFTISLSTESLSYGHYRRAAHPFSGPKATKSTIDPGSTTPPAMCDQTQLCH